MGAYVLYTVLVGRRVGYSSTSPTEGTYGCSGLCSFWRCFLSFGRVALVRGPVREFVGLRGGKSSTIPATGCMRRCACLRLSICCCLRCVLLSFAACALAANLVSSSSVGVHLDCNMRRIASGSTLNTFAKSMVFICGICCFKLRISCICDRERRLVGFQLPYRFRCALSLFCHSGSCADGSAAADGRGFE